MVFFALVTSIAVRSCLSLTITQMVVKAQVENATLHMDMSVCPMPVTPAITISEDVIAFVSVHSSAETQHAHPFNLKVDLRLFIRIYRRIPGTSC